MTTLPYDKFVIELGDPNNPGSFLSPCGLLSKSLDRSWAAVENPLPDCDDESLPSQILRGITSADWSITGTATIKTQDLNLYEDTADAGQPFPVRITFDLPLASGGRVYTGNAVFTQFNIKADHGARAATGDMTLSGAGKLTRTAAAA